MADSGEAIMAEARKLTRSTVERLWGVDRLPPPCESRDRRIGEIWFEPPQNWSLLVKCLFTSKGMSIQVHPATRTPEREPGDCLWMNDIAALQMVSEARLPVGWGPA